MEGRMGFLPPPVPSRVGAQSASVNPSSAVPSPAGGTRVLDANAAATAAAWNKRSIEPFLHPYDVAVWDNGHHMQTRGW